jgi:hypothetical protein
MDQHPAMMIMAAQQRTRDIAAEVAVLGQAKTPATLRGLLGFFAELLRGPRPAPQTRATRPGAVASAPAR